MFCVTTTLSSLDILLHCITTFHPFPATNMCKIQFSYIALAWYAKSAKISYVICQPVVLFCARMTPFIMKTGLSVKLTLAAEKLMTQRELFYWLRWQTSRLDSAWISLESLRCFGVWEQRLCKENRLLPNAYNLNTVRAHFTLCLLLCVLCLKCVFPCFCLCHIPTLTAFPVPFFLSPPSHPFSAYPAAHLHFSSSIFLSVFSHPSITPLLSCCELVGLQRTQSLRTGCQEVSSHERQWVATMPV